MNKSAGDIVREMDDRTAVRFLDWFCQKLFLLLRDQDVMGAVPESARNLSGFRSLLEQSSQKPGDRISFPQSVAVARGALTYFATQPGFAELLVDLWDQFKPDTLGSEATLTLGYVKGIATVLAADGIVLASSGDSFEKRSAQPKLVDALSSAAVSQDIHSELSPVQFSCFHPTEMCPSAWYSLLAYIHLPDAMKSVKEDHDRRLTEFGEGYRSSRSNDNYYLRHGTEVTVVPELTGFRFNPPIARVNWLEDWHCVEFRMQTTPEIYEFSAENAINGRVSFYVGPILVGEAKILAIVSDTPDERRMEHSPGFEASTNSMYHSVFVSYSHEDKNVIEQLEHAYKALGLEYLRDVAILRSGQEWNPELLKWIDRADLFQLCWSARSSESRYVEEEWRHALSLQREGFIRPTYWEVPKPKLPPEIEHLHFAWLEV